jgi:hypothetical protein
MSTAPKMAVDPSAEHIPGPAAPKHEEIALLAYRYWEGRGRPFGTPEEDWLRAERDILMERVVWGGRGSGSRPARKPHAV